MWAQRGIVFLDIKAGDYEAADAGIETILSNYPDHNDLPKAFQWLGDDYLEAGKYDKASNCYQYVIDKQLDGRWAISSRVGIARVNISLGDDEAVDEIIDGLIADYNDQSRLAQAVFRIGEEYDNLGYEYHKRRRSEMARNSFQKAIAVWARIIKDLPPSRITAEAYHLTGETWGQLGEYETAIDCYKKVLDDWPGYKYAGHLQFLIGRMYQKLLKSGGISKAEACPQIKAAYQIVAAQYPDTQAAPIAVKWLKNNRTCRDKEGQSNE